MADITKQSLIKATLKNQVHVWTLYGNRTTDNSMQLYTNLVKTLRLRFKIKSDTNITRHFCKGSWS